MPVSSHFKPGQSDRSRVKILTVDTANRRVEGSLKDGSMIQIAVWEVPAAFRWPQENEEWLVCRNNGIWMLDRRAQVAKVEALPITTMQPGAMKLDSTTIYDANGHALLPVASGTPTLHGPYNTGVLGGGGITQYTDVNVVVTHTLNTTNLTVWGHLYDGLWSSLCSWRAAFPTVNTVQIYIGTNGNKSSTAGLKFWLIG